MSRFNVDYKNWCDAYLIMDDEEIDIDAIPTDLLREAIRYLLSDISDRIDRGKESSYGEDL